MVRIIYTYVKELKKSEMTKTEKKKEQPPWVSFNFFIVD